MKVERKNPGTENNLWGEGVTFSPKHTASHKASQSASLRPKTKLFSRSKMADENETSVFNSSIFFYLKLIM